MFFICIFHNKLLKAIAQTHMRTPIGTNYTAGTSLDFAVQVGVFADHGVKADTVLQPSALAVDIGAGLDTVVVSI